MRQFGQSENTALPCSSLRFPWDIGTAKVGPGLGSHQAQTVLVLVCVLRGDGCVNLQLSSSVMIQTGQEEPRIRVSELT